jgi:hypothetical protein
MSSHVFEKGWIGIDGEKTLMLLLSGLNYFFETVYSHKRLLHCLFNGSIAMRSFYEVVQYATGNSSRVLETLDK